MVCIYNIYIFTGDDQNMFFLLESTILLLRYTPYVIIYFFFYFLGTSYRLKIILITTHLYFIQYVYIHSR